MSEKQLCNPQPSGEIVVPEIINCARCGGRHTDLTFKKLKKGISHPRGDYTHCASCPTNGEPILLRVE